MFFEPNTIEQVVRILAEQTTGDKITNMLSNLQMLPPDDITNNTKWKRLYNAVAYAQNNNREDTLIELTEYIMTPANFYKKGAAEYNFVADKLNVIFAMCGLELNGAGKIIKVQVARSLSEAEQRTKGLKTALEPYDIHPQILVFCRPEILTDNYFHLVFEAAKCILTHLRTLSDSSLDGIQLIDYCFSGNNPRILFNKLETNEEKDEYKGFQSLLRLIVHWYRNPQAHKSKILSYNTKEDTILALILMSKARRILDKCFVNTMQI